MKKINKYIKIGLLSFSLMGLVSCNDFLEKSPDNRMNLSSKEDVASLLVSAYPDIYPAYLLEMYSDNTDEYRIQLMELQTVFRFRHIVGKTLMLLLMMASAISGKRRTMQFLQPTLP